MLEANEGRLRMWIPLRVARAAAQPEIASRLAGFVATFDDCTEWRYGIFPPDGNDVLGEASLFPRAAAGRALLAVADHAEIGYWLRDDATGHGFATEAARALLGLAATLPALLRVEIRCDARNERSAAVPRRLGFHLAATIEEAASTGGGASVREQLWSYDLPSARLRDL